VEAENLRAKLAHAPARAQAALIQEFKDGKGVAYTQALATAIPGLSGEMKNRAREALAERLARMTIATLIARLSDDDAEMRRAAALAGAIKDDRTIIPHLIALLEDHDASVARASHAALKSLSGKDFGPPAGTAPKARAEAVAAWKAWWEKEGGK
jgi:hypothetical protein